MSRIVVIVFGRILNSIGGVIAIRLYTELLKPEQVGRLSLFLGLISLFNLILVAPVSSYHLRKAIEWHAEGTLIEQLSPVLTYSYISTAFVALTSIGLIRLGVLSAPNAAAVLVGLAVLGAGLSAGGPTLFNYLGRPFIYVALSCATSWGAVVLSGILCWRFSATAEAWLIGTVAAQLLIGFGSIVLIRRMERPENQRASGSSKDSRRFDLRAIALYSAPMLISTGLYWIQSDGYRYLFVHIANERSLGLFAAGFAVGVSPMLLLERLLIDTYVPILNRAVALNGRQHWPRSWDLYASACILPLVLFTMLSCSGTALFAKLLVSHTYYAVAWLGALGAIAKCLQMISSLYVGFSYAVLETTHLIIPYLCGGGVTIGCIFLLAPLSPFVRFGISLICGGAAILIVMERASRKRYNIKFPFVAFARAVALGLPIIGVNLASASMFPVRTAFGAAALLGADTLYMAAVCWILRPREADSIYPSSLSPMAESEKVA